MNSVSFEMMFCGTAVQEGRIRAKDLAVSFMALNDLFECVNQEMGGIEGTPSLEVKALQEGSFEIAFDLVKDTLSLWNKIPVNYLQDMLAIAGIAVQQGDTLGLLQLIKVLKGKVLDIKTDLSLVKEGRLSFSFGGTTYNIDQRTINLYQSPKALRSTDEITSSLDNEGIDEIRIGQDQSNMLHITSEDRDYYNLARKRSYVVSEKETQTVVVLSRISFRSSHKWYIRVGGSQSEYPVRILDEDFRKKVATREVTFGVGDKMEVLLKETEFIENEESKIRRDIVKVLQYIRGESQSELGI